MKLSFLRHFLEKYSDIKFHENPSSGSRVVLCCWTGRRTYIHDEGNGRFSQFYERAYNSVMVYLCFNMNYRAV